MFLDLSQFLPAGNHVKASETGQGWIFLQELLNFGHFSVSFPGPVLVITEYCCHGDLLNFLRSKAENFLNFVITIPNPVMDYKNVNTERMFLRRSV